MWLMTANFHQNWVTQSLLTCCKKNPTRISREIRMFTRRYPIQLNSMDRLYSENPALFKVDYQLIWDFIRISAYVSKYVHRK